MPYSFQTSSQMLIVFMYTGQTDNERELIFNSKDYVTFI